jgi:hypothetical protein
MGPRTRSGETSAGETSAAGALVPAPASSEIDFSAEWDSPSPPAGKHAPDSKEYWMAKSKLVSEAARDLFAAGRKMHERPLTLKATHPAWQVKKAEATHEDPARARHKVKGAWGDMDALQMLEKLDEQQREEEEAREAVAERKQQQAERKEERLAEEARKRDARETALALERPVTDLLKSLGFVALQNDSASASELAGFARANRAHLLGLGVDLSSLAKKELMPQLVDKVSTSVDGSWNKAQPKALPAPPDAAPAAAALVVVEATISGEPAAQPAPPAPPEEDDSTSEAPPKRPRRGRAAAAQ